ncbi:MULTISPECIES: alpha/beta fold hydrolase [Chryseobacterium]|uniref:Homoserine O-acetyltransferase n=1 Tax=Chryseobacterium camelliae TaxID=1265445 RepID=A0ABU0TNQ2_9FLAO|nr:MULTISPECIES: alpha/beta fold hydrolase [Chryseobacterium]MDT3407475.1 homoserine O-acetyltransferase [Pseudacidovorax intermedius]MDQ1098672.1 homoserine O-acetyltransferase [Chryseobacterium camelliae]MDQ1102600.1 homoserine O-acetyltransferase [Chryseobacterium sp. SORGH_AS_1048]MDR6086030.1 homoserine O-acetyltransferase [Chryseobacterium sp. SORGH_AS_0909]MDR6130398.1 homoserine O-acetyltransferase [Chryseobacterium sp. SORGH_AS_1175]
MKSELSHINLSYQTSSQKEYTIPLSYQLFGKDLFSAPVILVNHALTGNSNVAGEDGWWKQLIGENQVIDTNAYTVLCFNIPGNGYDGYSVEGYEDFTPADIAKIFLQGLDFLRINHLYAIIGGSLGGGIGWEMLVLKPKLTDIFIPIACDYRTHDWLHAQCLVQKFLLNQDDQPLQKARIHAMLCYRTPESLNNRFRNRYNHEKQRLESEDWLLYHGNALNERFSLRSYKLMNHLLMNINADEAGLGQIRAQIHFIAVDTDLFFPASEIRLCFEKLRDQNQEVCYHEIQSVHGHDAFLMEYQQLQTIIKNILER